MRPYLLILCLLSLLLLTAACSAQWTNSDIEGNRERKAQLKQDSLDCDVKAGEQYPLDKRRQYEVYDQCMEERGWTRRDAEIRFGKK
ncbi:hypothetical protein [Pseudodesulfovibrio sp.]|uniref:hypothetical protein n=1 Tax=unclassified Pseudodesulfovibrio TaxID=2661612 RepID=UPI003B0043E0